MPNLMGSSIQKQPKIKRFYLILLVAFVLIESSVHADHTIPECCTPVSTQLSREQFSLHSLGEHPRQEDLKTNPYVIRYVIERRLEIEGKTKLVRGWSQNAITEGITLTEGTDFVFSPEGVMGRIDQLSGFSLTPPELSDDTTEAELANYRNQAISLLNSLFRLNLEKAKPVGEGSFSYVFRAQSSTQPSLDIVFKIRKTFEYLTQEKELEIEYNSFRKNLVLPEVADGLAQSYQVHDAFGTNRRLVNVEHYWDTPHLWEKGILAQHYLSGPTATDIANYIILASRGESLTTRNDALEKLRSFGFASIEIAQKELALLERFYEKSHPYLREFQRINTMMPTDNYALDDGLHPVGLDLNHGTNVIWIPPRQDGSGAQFIIFDT